MKKLWTRLKSVGLPDWVYVDVVKILRFFPKAEFLIWGPCWGKWGICVVHIKTNYKPIPRKRSRKGGKK